MTAPRPVMEIAADLGEVLERMIRIQMTAYPSCWSEADKREVAMKHLFGEKADA